ncbi:MULTISPECIES: hypothetical protein [Cysteiniphilum]|uniref:Uncharacterized protein n=1 Tax=Cysteiniphilum litorale TaxID=2056700 RepID=A0A8J2Z2U0_9GAMM|nr:MULTISPECIES: hypothetical protein [Cysteiniphilum]GGF90915.1 hypothetical protein GCM10010995_05250 [Cysteiniphilum litorale]
MTDNEFDVYWANMLEALVRMLEAYQPSFKFLDKEYYKAKEKHALELRISLASLRDNFDQPDHFVQLLELIDWLRVHANDNTLQYPWYKPEWLSSSNSLNDIHGKIKTLIVRYYLSRPMVKSIGCYDNQLLQNASISRMNFQQIQLKGISMHPSFLRILIDYLTTDDWLEFKLSCQATYRALPHIMLNKDLTHIYSDHPQVTREYRSFESLAICANGQLMTSNSNKIDFWLLKDSRCTFQDSIILTSDPEDVHDPFNLGLGEIVEGVWSNHRAIIGTNTLGEIIFVLNQANDTFKIINLVEYDTLCTIFLPVANNTVLLETCDNRITVLRDDKLTISVEQLTSSIVEFVRLNNGSVAFVTEEEPSLFIVDLSNLDEINSTDDQGLVGYTAICQLHDGSIIAGNKYGKIFLWSENNHFQGVNNRFTKRRQIYDIGDYRVDMLKLLPDGRIVILYGNKNLGILKINKNKNENENVVLTKLYQLQCSRKLKVIISPLGDIVACDALGNFYVWSSTLKLREYDEN